MNMNLMIELSDHVKERYVERILMISDKKEAPKYLKENNNMISSMLWKMCEQSKVLIEGFDEPKNKSTLNLRSYEEYILVFNVSYRKLITIYSPLDFNSRMNKKELDNVFVEIRNRFLMRSPLVSALEKKGKTLRDVSYACGYVHGKLKDLKDFEKKDVIFYLRDMKSEMEIEKRKLENEIKELQINLDMIMNDCSKLYIKHIKR